MNVKELPDGKVLVICRAGCTNEEIISATGLHWTALFPESDVGRSTYADYRREAQRFPAQEVLAALVFELEVARIGLADVQAGKKLSDSDAARMRLAMKRIEQAVRIARGEH
jgi:hypothetical protein